MRGCDVPLYKQKGSNIWWVSLSHPDHPRVRRSTGTTDRKEAQRFEDELRAELWSTAPITGRTWGQAVILWVTAAERSESDIQSRRCVCPISAASDLEAELDSIINAARRLKGLPILGEPLK